MPAGWGCDKIIVQDITNAVQAGKYDAVEIMRTIFYRRVAPMHHKIAPELHYQTILPK
jgi:hypothetical protein